MAEYCQHKESIQLEKVNTIGQLMKCVADNQLVQEPQPKDFLTSMVEMYFELEDGDSKVLEIADSKLDEADRLRSIMDPSKFVYCRY